MVRKWSYLNSNYTNPYEKSKVITKTKTFQVFKKTTKFKKYNRGITKSVRQKYTQRKFLTTHLTFTQITSLWSLNYMQSKQIERFLQSMHYSPILSNSPDMGILNALTNQTNQSINFHLFSCSKNVLYRFSSERFGSKVLFNASTIKNTKPSYTQTNSLPSLAQNELTYPVNVCFGDMYYHPLTTNSAGLHTDVQKQLNVALFTYNLNLATVYYKVISKLSLLNIN